MNFGAGYAGPSPCPNAVLAAPSVVPNLTLLDLTGFFYLATLDKSGDTLCCSYTTTECYRLPLGSATW